MKQLQMLMALAAVSAACLAGCAGKKAGSVAVFVPGQTAGSSIYGQLAAGAERAGAEYGRPVLVVEAGYNQAEWESKLTMLAASGAHELIVSSNPSMPYFVSAISGKFPKQRFLLMDAELAGNPNVYTLCYNQREQSYMAGYLAGLLSPGARAVGLLAAQDYPVMSNVILPGYREGANAAGAFEVDFRVIGNWFDAQKAAELGAGMASGGVKAILTIAGAANEGLVQAAADRGVKAIWFDGNGYAARPGTVAGSVALMQEAATYDRLSSYFKGTLPFGMAERVGVRDGYVRFIDDDPLYLSTVPEDIREKQALMIARIMSGELALD